MEDTFAFLGFLGALTLVTWALRSWRLRKRVTLLPHQAGILFRSGKLVGAVAPVSRVRLPIEKVFLLDRRLAPIGVENQVVTLADGTVAIYGFSAIAELRDAAKALYSARNYNDVPAFHLLCAARKELNRATAGRVKTAAEQLAGEIAKEAESRLAPAGFGLQSFRFTQLAFATPPRL